VSGIRIDTSEVNRLGIDLSEAPGRMQRKAPKVFARGALEIKRRLQRDATGHGHLPHLQDFVSYDRLGLLRYEIGFTKAGQGNLGNIAVYGSVNNAPVMQSPAYHAEREAEEIVRHLGDAGEDAVLGGDGER
jgi:hypothetical protein